MLLKGGLLVLFLLTQALNSFSQTDVEFWFVAPEITIGHGNFPGGEPVYFRVSALELDATVRIFQPANPAGMDTTFTVPARSTFSLDASPWINDLENRPGGIVLNKGVQITSTNLITVYYDEDEYWNQDIFALKGGNALGYEFYTPFQNLWNNPNWYTPLAYSAADIVATEDNTVITITPTANLVGPHAAGVPFTITLNKGETFSCLATSQAAAGHLGGTHIVSNKPIAVTIKDDSVHGGVCDDLIGDQTVPIVNASGSRIVGFEYIVMRGKININNPGLVPPDPDGVPTGERIFIMATEPNTQVFIDGVLLTTLANPGQETAYEIRNNSTHVKGDKPIMVLHTSGFGCELGGAILPTIDGCTGSVEVSFTRSTDRDFYLNIMTIDAAKNSFTMHYEDGSTFTIPGTWFEPVGVTDYVCLSKNNKLFANSKPGGVPQGEVVKITNSVSVFHLGLIEGGTTTGCKYGYFSDYSEARGDVLVVESGSKSIFRCFGDTIQLRANGGISYSWSPSTYLNDAFIATPIATPPPGIYNYDVTMTRGCFADTTISVIVGIAEQVEAFYEADEWFFCAPDTVTFDNKSFGVDLSSMTNVQWDFDLQDPSNPFVYDTSSVMQHYFTNTTDSVIAKTVQLVVWNSQSCVSEFRRDILIKPEINAGFTNDISDGCHPVTVNFTNTSTGNTDRYKWNLGDGNSSISANVAHTYFNQGMADSLYHVEMVAISPFFCSDTVETDITIYPYIEAAFALDTFQGCSPLVISVDNNSAGYIEEYEWTMGDGTTYLTSASTFNHTYTNTTAAPIQYNLRLVVKNNARGCTDTLVRVVSVYPEVTSSFIQDQSSVCHGTEVGFTNQSAGTATLFEWDFGDGGSSSAINPFHTFENMTPANVDYTVRLVSTTQNLCRDTSYQTLRTHPYVHAEFSLNEFQGCAPFQVVLHNASMGAISDYAWNWGDGLPPSTSGATTLTHLYQNTGPAAVTNNLQLIVQNADGCADTMARNITVFPEVVSQFTQDLTEGCNELLVSFANESSPSATSFLWEFGDGASTDQWDPQHLFENTRLTDSTYTTRLIAATAENCRDTSQVDIEVFSYIHADFTFSKATLCSPFDLTLYNSSVGGVSFHWDFGDGRDTTVLNTNPVIHRYTNPSPANPVTYTIVLTVTNARNCISVQSKEIQVMPSVQASFTADITEGCTPLDVSFTNTSLVGLDYRWEFGDNTSSILESPSHTYTNESNLDNVYQVKLTVISDNFCTDSAFMQITVFPEPKAKFDVDQTVGCSPLNVTIENLSEAGDSYIWTFGDGSAPINSTDYSPVAHNYINDSPDVQHYEVRLEVANNQGCTDFITQNITVYPSVDVDFERDSAGCSPYFSQFTNTSQRASTFIWNFGDGGFSYVSDPGHTYVNTLENNLIVNVELTGYSPYGCTDSMIRQVTIYPSPEARFSYNPIYQYFPNTTVSLVNETNAGNYNFEWDFNDGLTSTERDPGSHTYADWGEYNIKLKASNTQCSDSLVHWVKIFPPQPVADFVVDRDTGCLPLLVAFTNNSLYGEEYLWEFDDGATSTDFEPTHTFTRGGFFQVKLTVTGEGGVDYAFHEFEIFVLPEPDFFVEPTLVMLPDEPVKTFNLTKYGTSYLWDFGDGTTYHATDTTHQYTLPGVYDVALTAWTQHGCEAYMIIPEAVTVIGEGTIKFPNVFKPNPSGPIGGDYNAAEHLNQVFYPVYEGVVEYDLSIYNRWGELLFNTTDINRGWDGYYKGSLCVQGVYVWKCTVTYGNGTSNVMAGDVTLLHKPF